MSEKLRSHIEKIIPLTDDEFAFVGSHFTTRSARRGELLIEAGQRVTHAYFVVAGLLKLGYTDTAGKDFIVSFAPEDWWETDFAAYYTETPASLSLQCLEDTQLNCLALQDYYRLCAGLPKMTRFFLEKANRGHVGSQQRILSFLTLNARERYDQLLHRYPALSQRVSRTLLAAYLGVSRETLSRLAS